MFFIIGISNGEKQIEFDQPLVCPCCGKFGRLELHMTYMFFSLFFIPLIKWNKRYFVRTTCCSAACELPEELGHSIARGETTQLDINVLHFSCQYGAVRICKTCGYETAEDFQYCPKCGHSF